jgi:hypothetical protein
LLTSMMLHHCCAIHTDGSSCTERKSRLTEHVHPKKQLKYFISAGPHFERWSDPAVKGGRVSGTKKSVDIKHLYCTIVLTPTARAETPHSFAN